MGLRVKIDVERLRIIKYPDPRLRQVTEPISEVTPLVRDVARKMLELMVADDGVGLAAPQVGLPWRMFVSNPSGEPGEQQVFVNPHLRDLMGSLESEEGCLSIPNVNGIVRRGSEVTIVATD